MVLTIMTDQHPDEHPPRVAGPRLPEPDPQSILVLEAAYEVLRMFTNGWRRAPSTRRDCDEYSPEVIRFWLTGSRNAQTGEYELHWQMLEAQIRGLASGIPSSGADPRALSNLKADLELATDKALAPILHWQAVARIYKRQSRWVDYLNRRTQFVYHDSLDTEPRYRAIAEFVCFERMARWLGWYPAESEKAA